VKATATPVHTPTDIQAVMTTLGAAPGGGLVAPADSTVSAHRKLIFQLAARYRIPAIYGSRYIAEGGLVSYGVDVPDEVRQAAAYVDRILRGGKPGDLPVQQPTKFGSISKPPRRSGSKFRLPYSPAPTR
jgi:putative tryptophan/tyrosine transport system substrate-binding protein